MTLPTNLDYPIIAIADLHGQLEQLERLVARLEMTSEWDDCALVFLGDYVDRGEDVPGTIDIVLEVRSQGREGQPSAGTMILRWCIQERRGLAPNPPATKVREEFRNPRSPEDCF